VTVRINPDIPTVEIVASMFPRPLRADSKWAYRHGAYKEIRKAQRRGTEFAVKWSDDILTLLNLRGEDWYAVPTDMLIGDRECVL
jgi:hypothetical protein